MELPRLTNLTLSLLVQLFLHVHCATGTATDTDLVSSPDDQIDNLTISRHEQSSPHSPRDPTAAFAVGVFESQHFDLIFNLSARFVDFIAAEDRAFIDFYQPSVNGDGIEENVKNASNVSHGVNATENPATCVGGLLRDLGAAISWPYLADNSDRLWTHFLTHKLATTSLILSLLVIVCCFPVFGFFFCVCRCCCGGRCGGKSHEMDRRWDNCRR